ncbi:MAG: HypC/HybG/HupF family hydrogenase formation chaperone [Anaerolineae bacterium]|jgi:hydrogenase expression/formation protein HypC|nr:HypC/HybG/HupF family hydrogenase formation chaperone [Anaerolineae bacterium]
MCLGIPGKIVEIYETDGLKMGKIDFGGVIKEACLAYVPDAQVGEYTIIHVGFALNRIDEDEAQKTLELFNQIGLIEEELDIGDA